MRTPEQTKAIAKVYLLLFDIVRDYDKENLTYEEGVQFVELMTDIGILLHIEDEVISNTLETLNMSKEGKPN